MELWLEESHKHDEEQQKEGRSLYGRGEKMIQGAVAPEGGLEEWRRIEEERAQKSEEIMRTLAASLAERKHRRPRTEFGVDSLKLFKLTWLDDIEAFMTIFERSLEGHEIECENGWCCSLCS